MSKKFVILLLVLCFVLVSCNAKSNTDNNSSNNIADNGAIHEINDSFDSIEFYADYPDIIDFGSLSLISPEVHYEEVDASTTYLYNIENELDLEVFETFYKSIDENQYIEIDEPSTMEDGGIYRIFANRKTQLLIGEYTNIEDNFIDLFIISMRPKYISYENYNGVPDYGIIYKIEPTETKTEDGVSVFIYEANNDFDSYLEALDLYEFSYITHDIDEECMLVLYTSEIHNVLIIDCFPNYTSIVVGNQ